MATRIVMTKEFEPADLRSFSTMYPAAAEFVVERRLRRAAEQKLVSMARDLSFETDRPMRDALAHVVAKHPDLLRLSRAKIDDRDADVVLR